MIKGNDLIIQAKVGNVYQTIAACNSCEVENVADVKEISSPSSGVYREFVSGRKAWTVRANFFVPTNARVYQKLTQVGDTFHLKLYVRNYASDYLIGDAILVQAKVTGTTGNVLTGSWVFQGTGLLQ
jgi:hypothetical protein